MVDMINFLKYHGAKVWKGKRIYLKSIPAEDFPIFISLSEHSKAYFDIREKAFYKLSWKYGENLKAKAEEEKEQIEEWIKEQETKQAEAMAIKAESAKEESKQANEELNKLKARIEKNRDKEKAKGFYSLCLLICEKFNFKEKEAVNKTTDVIEHGMVYFTLRNEELKKIIIKDLESQKYLTENLIPLIEKQLNKVNTFDDLFNYVHTGDFLEMKKNVSSFICKSESSKPLATVDNKPQRSEAQKQADRKYNESEKGKEANRKYRESEKGKATRANYLKSENGKQAREKANRKYRESEKGQQSQKQAYNKYLQSEKGKEARLKAVKSYRERQKALKASQGGIINGFHQKES